MKKRLVSILLCAALCLCCLAGAALAADDAANPNVYTLELKQTSGTTYDVILTQTVGNDGIAFMSATLISRYPEQIAISNTDTSGLTVTNNGSGVIVLHRLDPEPLTLVSEKPTTIATLTVNAGDVLRYDESSTDNGISNVSYKSEASLIVTISPYTAVPDLSGKPAVVSGSQRSVSFPLNTEPAAETAYHVYSDAAGTTPVSSVTAAYDPATKSLVLTGPITPPAVYYVTATNGVLHESAPVPVCVWAKNQDNSVTAVSPLTGSALKALYNANGQMLSCSLIDLTEGVNFTLSAGSGVSKCRLFFVGQNYLPTRPAMSCAF